MGKNLSNAISSCSANLTKPQVNQLAKISLFNFDNLNDSQEYKADFESPHDMIEEVEPTCWCIYHLLEKGLRPFVRHYGMTKPQNDKVDKDTNQL